MRAGFFPVIKRRCHRYAVAVENYPKKIVVQCLALVVLGGFALLLVTMVRPALVVVYPLALTLLKLWCALMVFLLGALVLRLGRSDQTTAMHRKVLPLEI